MGQETTARKLLAAGAKVDLGEDPVEMARKGGHEQVAQLLEMAGKPDIMIV